MAAAIIDYTESSTPSYAEATGSSGQLLRQDDWQWLRHRSSTRRQDFRQSPPIRNAAYSAVTTRGNCRSSRTRLPGKHGEIAVNVGGYEGGFDTSICNR